MLCGTDHFQSLMWRTLGLAISPPAFERLQSCMRHTMDQIDSIHCAGDTWWPADIYLQWPMLVASIVLLEHLPNVLHCARAQLPTTLRLSTCSGTLPYLQYSFKAQSLFTMELYTAYIIRNGCKLLHNFLRDGFVVGAGFWGFVGSSWQQMFIFCTVMPSYACCQRYCCKISSIWYIYIYAYLKNFIQLGHKKQNILHMHSEKLHNAINGSMSFSQWISERKIQFCPVAPCSNDRVLFACMLQVFIASMNKRKQHFWLTEDFILSPSSTASSRAPYIKRYGMFCQGKHIVPLKNVVLLNPSTASTQILRATACFS